MPVWRDFFSLFPTCVGGDLHCDYVAVSLFAVPHVCGGWSNRQRESIVDDYCSPRVWGVILPNELFATQQKPVPHVCGGDPLSWRNNDYKKLCSPRVWGWSLLRHAHWVRHFLFPTHVGVILRWLWRLFFHKLLFPTSVGVILAIYSCVL